jgi:hypothetical protein
MLGEPANPNYRTQFVVPEALLASALLVSIQERREQAFTATASGGRRARQVHTAQTSMIFVYTDAESYDVEP